MGRAAGYARRVWGAALDLALLVATVFAIQFLFEATSERPFHLIMFWLVGVSIAGVPLMISSWARGEGIGRILGLWAAQGVYSLTIVLLLYHSDSLFGGREGTFLAVWGLSGLWVIVYVGLQCGVIVATCTRFPQQITERLACVVQLAHALAVAIWVYIYFRYDP